MIRPRPLAQLRLRVAKHTGWRYRSPVTVNPVADLGRSSSNRRTSAHHPIAGAFFASAMLRYGGCARDTFGCAGFLFARSANLRTAVSNPCLAASGDGSTQIGAVPMTHDHALNTSALRDRAAAHRAMALAALRADSSLSNRLRRYNHHMTVARTLEAEQQKAASNPPPVLSWLKTRINIRAEG